ncbi:MAG TPA: histidine kinase [Flavihumibacter sp.]|jgi:two-component system sensor histidine kinase AlgZ
MNNSFDNPFIFSSRYRVLRHLIFWTVHVIIFTFAFWPSKGDQLVHLTISTMWAILAIVYCYPVMYWIIPRYLLTGKYYQFAAIMFFWAVLGWFWSYFCRRFIYFPVADALGFNVGEKNPWSHGSYLMMSVMMGVTCSIVLFKYWIRKQNDFLMEKNEKISAQLELLKAQVHPHFLFNTLNNIYSFSLKNYPETPQMLLQLSSLLSYMLYDCKAPEVPLDKEIEVMCNYIDLEKIRYGQRLEVSINVEGDIRGNKIAPLLILPFLENAFKHGTSEQLEKAWLSMDIGVRQHLFHCKIANSKNEWVWHNENGIGVQNVQKRLAYLYPGKHELKLSDEGNFFVVSLVLQLNEGKAR